MSAMLLVACNCGKQFQCSPEIIGGTISCECGNKFKATTPELEERRRQNLETIKFVIRGVLIFTIVIGVVGLILFFCVKVPDEASQLVKGIFYLVMGTLAFVIAAMWVVFPVIVYLLLKKIEAHLSKLERYARPV